MRNEIEKRTGVAEVSDFELHLSASLRMGAATIHRQMDYQLPPKLMRLYEREELFKPVSLEQYRTMWSNDTA